jgi:hypothetical protein
VIASIPGRDAAGGRAYNMSPSVRSKKMAPFDSTGARRHSSTGPKENSKENSKKKWSASVR